MHPIAAPPTLSFVLSLTPLSSSPALSGYPRYKGPGPAFYTKSPRTYKVIRLYCAEFKYISNSDEKVNGYLAGLARYDILEEKGLIPHKLRQLRNTRAAPSSDIR
jgi:hypothetical protein